MLSVLFSSAQTVTVVVQVNMSGITINPAGVHVMGSFNSWNPNGPLMTDLGGGIYEQAFTVNANSIVQFRFVNGANISDGENLPGSCSVSTNGYTVRQENIGTSNVLFGPFCYNTCNICDVTTPTTVNVTFRVDMSGQTIASSGVHVAGSFQGWNPSTNVMNDLGNNLYSLTLPVAIGSNIQYKFINGNAWTGAETVPSSCGLADGFGGFNRSTALGSTDVILDAVCFNECAACMAGIVDGFATNAVVYPNPARDQIQYRFDRRAERLILFDSQGKLILSKNNAGNNGIIDLQQCIPGFYKLLIVYSTHTQMVSVMLE
jgi:hypothetical protein